MPHDDQAPDAADTRVTEDEQPGALGELDMAILEFAEHAPRTAGIREEAVRRQLGISPVRYYQRLNVLVDHPEARRLHPLLIGRLARLRERRR